MPYASIDSSTFASCSNAMVKNGMTRWNRWNYCEEYIYNDAQLHMHNTICIYAVYLLCMKYEHSSIECVFLHTFICEVVKNYDYINVDFKNRGQIMFMIITTLLYRLFFTAYTSSARPAYIICDVVIRCTYNSDDNFVFFYFIFIIIYLFIYECEETIQPITE